MDPVDTDVPAQSNAQQLHDRDQGKDENSHRSEGFHLLVPPIANIGRRTRLT